jgi:hypothetical protein
VGCDWHSREETFARVSHFNHIKPLKVQRGPSRYCSALYADFLQREMKLWICFKDQAFYLTREKSATAGQFSIVGRKSEGSVLSIVITVICITVTVVHILHDYRMKNNSNL